MSDLKFMGQVFSELGQTLAEINEQDIQRAAADGYEEQRELDMQHMDQASCMSGTCRRDRVTRSRSANPTPSPGALIGRLRLRQIRRDGRRRADAAGVDLPPAPPRGFSRRAFMAQVQHAEQLEHAIFRATFMLSLSKTAPAWLGSGVPL